MATKKKPKAKAIAPVIMTSAELMLDLGCGKNPASGFRGVDIAPGVAEFCVHLWDGKRWPWDDNSVSQLRSSHVIEHIKADYIEVYDDKREKDAFFFFFDEAFRVAKPGATFNLQWPALKNHRAFQDLTHRRFIPAESLLYLDVKWREANSLDHYNVRCDWVLESTSPTIPEVLAKLHPGEQGAAILRQKLSECWGIEQDTVATLRARK